MSQSYLKNLSNGIKYFKDQLDEPHKETEYFLIGSAVDTLLTGTHEDFDEEYYILDDNSKFTGKECTIVENLYKDLMIVAPGTIKEKTLNDLQKQILIQADLIEYQTKWKSETRVNKIIEKGSEYFELLKTIGNKKVLTSDQFILISTIVSNFRNHIDVLNPSIIEEKYKDNPNTHLYFQAPSFATVDNVNLKGLKDLCIIDWNHKDKVVIASIFDIKTTSKRVLDFPESAKTFRYDLQAAMYYRLTELELKEEAPDYTIIINPITFIVESTTSPGMPCTFTMDMSIVYKALNELDSLIETYKWHKENDEWEIDKDIIVNGNNKSILLDQWEEH